MTRPAPDEPPHELGPSRYSGSHIAGRLFVSFIALLAAILMRKHKPVREKGE